MPSPHQGFAKLRNNTNMKQNIETEAVESFACSDFMINLLRWFYVEEICHVKSGINDPKVFIDVCWTWLNIGGMDNQPASLFCWMVEIHRRIKDHSPAILVKNIIRHAEPNKVKTIFLKWR